MFFFAFRTILSPFAKCCLDSNEILQIKSDSFDCLVIQHVVAAIRATHRTVVEMVTCSFIRTESDTRVSKATSCKAGRTESARLTVNGPHRCRSAGVSTSIFQRFTVELKDNFIKFIVGLKLVRNNLRKISCAVAAPLCAI